MDERVSIGDPGPLGLGAFAMTTFVLSAVNAGWVAAAAAPVFLTLGLFYGGLAQVLAGMWEFRKNNTFGATAFTSYGAFWLALASLVLLELLKVVNFGPAGAAATGLFLVAWTVFTFYMWVGSLRINTALILVFSALLVTFLLLDVGALGGVAAATTLGGWVGILTAVFAWYASAAGVLHSLAGHAVLPVGPRQKA